MKNRTLHKQQPESGWTKQKKTLADACGISRPTLDAYIRQDTFPQQNEAKGWNISDCREWVLRNTEKSAIAASLDSDIADLKKWDIFERARKQKIANDLKEKLLMPVAEHEEVLRDAFRETVKELLLIPGRSPELTGLSAADLSERLTAMLLEGIKHLSDLQKDAPPLVKPD